MKNKYISWRRVSTFKQNKSGLGLEAQREIIQYFVEREGGKVIADYEECYTGKELNGCVELRKAMEHAKREGAILVIAKSDRFRNCQEALGILTEMGEGNIEFCDLPHSDRFTLTLFWALAEREALITSIRTKQALAVKKAQGCKMGAANEVYRENYDKLTQEQKKERFDKMGSTKNKRRFENRDTQALIKVLQRVFELDNNIESWVWSNITFRGGNYVRIVSMMEDFQELDESGKTFAKWVFSDINDKKLYHKVASAIQSLRRSVMYRKFNQ